MTRSTLAAVLCVVALGSCGAVDGPDVADDGPTEVIVADEQRTTAHEDPPEAAPTVRTYRVRSVTDGDTLSLGNGQDVRLVGIDAPERGACGEDRATRLLERLVLGRHVVLTAPVDDRDRYGRLLRYVDVGSRDVGLALIRSGLAAARYDSRDGYDPHPRERRYVRADADNPAVTCAAPAPPTPPAVPRGFVGGGGSDPSCEPGYSPCVPLYPPDLNCADTGPVRVTGPDPHRLDGDGDGFACAE